MDTMRWTPQMEEALRAVGASKECPTDEVFAFQAPLQQLAQRAAQVREQQEADHALWGHRSGISTTPSFPLSQGTAGTAP
jgi:hypothetical protein